MYDDLILVAAELGRLGREDDLEALVDEVRMPRAGGIDAILLTWAGYSTNRMAVLLRVVKVSKLAAWNSVRNSGEGSGSP